MTAIRRRSAVLVVAASAVLALAGCGGRELQRNDGFVRPATSASVRFYVPASLNIRISRSGYGYVPPIGAAEQARAQKDLREMFRQIERELEARLQQNGLPRGDDLVLALDVEQALHTNYGPGPTINVRAVFKGAPPGTAVWSFKYQALTSIGEDAQASATRFADKVIHEVQAAGMLPGTKR